MRKALAFCLIVAASPALPDPANTLRDLSARLNGCFAGVKLTSEAEATVVFSLKRDGSLNGKPRLSYTKFPADEAERAADARAIAQALDACLPIAITDGLGGAIAGRPIALRLGWRKPATGV